MLGPISETTQRNTARGYANLQQIINPEPSYCNRTPVISATPHLGPANAIAGLRQCSACLPDIGPTVLRHQTGCTVVSGSHDGSIGRGLNRKLRTILLGR